MNFQIIQETGVDDASSTYSSSQDEHTVEKIPGLTKPINYYPDRIVGPLTALGRGEDWDRPDNHFQYVGERATAREVAMLNFINQITDKPGWERKVYYKAITNKWRREIKALGKVMDNEATLDYCMAELKDKAEHFKETGLVAALDLTCAVIKSDTNVQEDLRISLINACKPLQDCPEVERDWHPRSDNQVLNLVHPSLYPLIYGRTRALQRPLITRKNYLSWCGEATVIPAQDFGIEQDRGYWWSSKFQWLPCEVTVEEDGSASIKSYINNLHPDAHAALYGVIERIIEEALPLWNEALVVDGTVQQRIRFMGPAEFRMLSSSELPDGQKPEWLEFDEMFDEDEIISKVGQEGFDQFTQNFDLDLHRDYIHPEPPDSTHDAAELRRIARTGWLKDHLIENPNLQIIIKIAGIELSPEKPKYQGGNWHLEGQLNEHIVATALYYYDCDNVTESGLDFRHTASLMQEDLTYEQGDFGGLEEIFGTELSGEAPPIQELGRVQTNQGRMLAFPNTMQHRVTPLELVDATKPGHRRFIALWLVDPTIRVVSTAYVPPQQLEWWPSALTDRSESILAAAAQLPQELRQMIFQYYLPNGIQKDEALAYRLELMDERSQDVSKRESEYIDQTRAYFLCEH